MSFAGALLVATLDGRALFLLPPFGLSIVPWLDADGPTIFQMSARSPLPVSPWPP